MGGLAVRIARQPVLYVLAIGFQAIIPIPAVNNGPWFVEGPQAWAPGNPYATDWFVRRDPPEGRKPQICVSKEEAVAVRDALNGMAGSACAVPSEMMIDRAAEAPLCTKHSHHDWGSELPTELAVWRERAESVVCRACIDIRLRAAWAVAPAGASEPSEFAIALVARTIHAAWRDGMLAQDRDVAEPRMNWETLDERDKRLDYEIARRVLRSISGAAAPRDAPQEPVSDALALIRRALAMRDYGDKPGIWERVWTDIADAAQRLGDALAVGSERAVRSTPRAAPVDLSAMRAALDGLYDLQKSGVRCKSCGRDGPYLRPTLHSPECNIGTLENIYLTLCGAASPGAGGPE